MRAFFLVGGVGAVVQNNVITNLFEGKGAIGVRDDETFTLRVCNAYVSDAAGLS